jgi:hypothetical protein
MILGLELGRRARFWGCLASQKESMAGALRTCAGRSDRGGGKALRERRPEHIPRLAGHESFRGRLPPNSLLGARGRSGISWQTGRQPTHICLRRSGLSKAAMSNQSRLKANGRTRGMLGEIDVRKGAHTGLALNRRHRGGSANCAPPKNPGSPLLVRTMTQRLLRRGSVGATSEPDNEAEVQAV